MNLDETIAVLDADLAAARHSATLEPHHARMVAVLRQVDPWPDVRAGDADAANEWEVCVCWHSEHGRVELGTEEDGTMSYYVLRKTPPDGDDRREQERTLGPDELPWVMSFLGADEPPLHKEHGT